MSKDIEAAHGDTAALDQYTEADLVHVLENLTHGANQSLVPETPPSEIAESGNQALGGMPGLADTASTLEAANGVTKAIEGKSLMGGVKAMNPYSVADTVTSAGFEKGVDAAYAKHFNDHLSDEGLAEQLQDLTDEIGTHNYHNDYHTYFNSDPSVREHLGFPDMDDYKFEITPEVYGNTDQWANLTMNVADRLEDPGNKSEAFEGLLDAVHQYDKSGGESYGEFMMTDDLPAISPLIESIADRDIPGDQKLDALLQEAEADGLYNPNGALEVDPKTGRAFGEEYSEVQPDVSIGEPLSGPAPAETQTLIDLPTAAGVLNDNLPAFHDELKGLQESGHLNPADANMLEVIESPMPGALYKSLHDGGVENLDISGKPMDSPRNVSETLLESAADAFDPKTMEKPDLSAIAEQNHQAEHEASYDYDEQSYTRDEVDYSAGL